MRDLRQRKAFLWTSASAMALLWPALAAYAQVESLADWQAKDRAGGYAKPLKPTSVRFGGLRYALRTGQWQDPDQDPQLFTDYYQKQVFPFITDPDKRGDRQDVVAKLRSDFKALSKDPNSPVLATLVNITLEYMPPIVQDPKWHPSVRENALLAIGEVKSPLAVTVLLNLISDKKLHPAFKITAMRGLAHLAERDPAHPNEPNALFSNSAVAGPVVALMITAVRSNPEKPADSLIWIRGQAADVLGAIGSTGTSGEVPIALLGMVSDEKLPLTMRSTAARALGKLKYGGSLPDAATYTKAFADFGSAALDKNLPGEAGRIWAVCDDFLGGLKPVYDSGSPKLAVDMYNAMDALRKAASKTTATGGYPSEEELKPAVGKARKVLDAAAGKK